MSYKKINSILCLFAFSLTSVAATAQVVDSTLPRPNKPSIGTLKDSNTSDLEKKTPDSSTITEYLREVCPSGLTGPDGTNMITVSQRHVTTYKYNGNIVGVSESPWEDVDEECKGREIRDLGCESGQRGAHKQERTKVTSANNTFEYSNWKDILNTCEHYKIKDDYEIRYGSCPAWEQGQIKERRNFELWSDGSHRNYSGWLLESNTCKPVVPWTAITESYDLPFGTYQTDYCSGMHGLYVAIKVNFKYTWYDGRITYSDQGWFCGFPNSKATFAPPVYPNYID